jgi:hypothetical protein
VPSLSVDAKRWSWAAITDSQLAALAYFESLSMHDQSLCVRDKLGELEMVTETDRGR